MPSFFPSVVIGYHGCDQKVGEAVLAGKKKLRSSTNAWDWLGHGTYFWENNPSRALKYAKDLKKHPSRSIHRIKTPFVIGAIIDLGNCLNLLESEHLDYVKLGYSILKISCKIDGKPLPENRPLKNETDLIIRNLDCAVIQALHNYHENVAKKTKYDSVRGMFVEGKSLYKNAGFNEKNHIQICVRNPDSIKAFFRIPQV